MLLKKQQVLGEDLEKFECLCTVGRDIKWYSHYGKQYSGFSKKLKIELADDPVFSISKELRAGPQG